MPRRIFCLALVAVFGCRGSAETRVRAPVEVSAAPAASSCDAAELQRAASDLLRARGKDGAVVLVDLRSMKEVAVAQTEGLADVAVHPASSVKPFVALAGLQAGVVGHDETLPCEGTWKHEDFELTCFAEHGPIDLATALATSCNAYTYEVARRVGPVGVAEQYERVGLTELAGTIRGIDRDAPEFFATALGHGEAAVTPREMAGAWAKMVTRGDPGWAAVKEGLRAAVREEYGTARGAGGAGMEVAGKTGTAEGSGAGTGTGTGTDTDTGTHTDTGSAMHGWFAGFSPVEEPRWVVVAYLRDGGTGGQGAAPLAGEVLRAAQAACPAG